MEKCENCGSLVGDLETPHVWRDRVVCPPCHQKLTVGNPAYIPNSRQIHAHVIELKCINCGSKLAIDKEMETATCRYCGTEMLVQRHGQLSTLRPIEKALQNVQSGTDTIAIELAIARYERELAALCMRQQEMNQNWWALLDGEVFGIFVAIFMLPLKIYNNWILEREIEAKRDLLNQKRDIVGW